jgi:tetratricopeptide (TPR) repeat protein
MSKSARLASASVLILLVSAPDLLSARPSTKSPLSSSTLLALLAGNALPEAATSAIETRGLAFKPTDDYRAQLSLAGATPEVLQALSKAQVYPVTQPQNARPPTPIWQHLALAGKLIREKKYSDAEREVNAAMVAGADRLDAGFVMGEALRRQEQWIRAEAVYHEILRVDEDFPQAYTKLSFIVHSTGDNEESLRIAKVALAAVPNDAEAHKNAGLALENMRKFDAAAEEYRQALQIKPDYALVHFDLGVLLYNKGDFEGSISEYKKSLALNARDLEARIDLGLAYSQVNDGDNAIRVLREAKKLAPRDFSVRQNLGSVLVQQRLYADAVVELRELEAMAPESVVCHLCLATALYNMQDYESARKECQIAIRLDPSDPVAYRELGRVYEAQQKFELALKQYRQAQSMDADSAETRLCIARVLLQSKQAGQALQDLKLAKDTDPGNPQIHEQLGKALEAMGDLEQAKTEYKEALLLDGESAFVLLDLAELLEKQGDWPGAIEYYRAASKKVESSLMTTRGPQVVDAPGVYQGAFRRFNDHLSQLRAAGKSAEAAQLAAQVQGLRTSQGLSGQLDAAMEAASDAFRNRRLDDAERSYQDAVKLGEQLQPHEGRLIMSLGFLGSLYYNRKDLADAQDTFERQLKVAEEVYGPASPQLSPTLEMLSRLSLERGDTASAESFAQQDLTLSEKNAATDNLSYSMSLMTIGYVYYTEKNYEKAEPYIEKAVKIHGQLSGPQAMILVSSQGVLCMIYDALGQPANAEPCDSQLLKLVEQYYGANSPALAPILASESKALRDLGRSVEADSVDRRMQSLQQAAVDPN